jgi:predicted GIY-YIG superfamily endonuclease
MHTVIKKCGQTVVIDSDSLELYLVQIPDGELYLWNHKGLTRELPRHTVEHARETLAEYQKSDCHKERIPSCVKKITWNQTIATPDASSRLKQLLREYGQR